LKTSRSPEETIEIAERLASENPDLPAFYLQGDLGAGKTLFAKGIARYYGVDPDDVTSPTFALVNRYGGGRRVLYHLDLYRIDDERELEELGIEDMEEEGAVLVVEWAEKMGRFRRSDAIEVRIEVVAERERTLTVRAPGRE
jgi:tRNA threonylcarbamoyladenosine biosynthesis protein TsaE